MNKYTLKERVEELTEIKRLIVEKDPDDSDKFLHRLWDLASEAQEEIDTLLEQERKVERERCLEVIKSYRIYDWSDEQAIYNQLEEIVDRIQNTTQEDVINGK